MHGSETTEGDGQARTAENVVRLPRDWLGPREELVPIGSRADALDHSDDDATSPLPPAASSFWDEDSGSVQAAMQAPAGEWQSPQRRARRGPARGQSSVARIPRLRWLRIGPLASRGRTRLALGLLAACVIAVLAVIGLSEGPSSPAGRRSAAIGSPAQLRTPRGVQTRALAGSCSQGDRDPIRATQPTCCAHVPPCDSHRTAGAGAPSATRRHQHVQPKASSSSGASGAATATTPTTTASPATTPAASAPVDGQHECVGHVQVQLKRRTPTSLRPGWDARARGPHRTADRATPRLVPVFQRLTQPPAGTTGQTRRQKSLTWRNKYARSRRVGERRSPAERK